MGTFLIWTGMFFQMALAADQLPGDSYYTIRDTANIVNTLNFVEHNEAPPKPQEKYVRYKHFGDWIDDPTDDTCLYTRGRVLERDSQVPLVMYEKWPCTVAQGKWYDPYTDQTYTEAHRLQIDHIVPLKNAYLSGAHDWSWRKRCAYFNFLGNSQHLIPVESSTNTAKLDSGPDRWLPPNKNYRCEYLAHWLKVKAIWKLKISETEGQAILKLVKQQACSPTLYRIPHDVLVEQRLLASDTAADICPASPPPLSAMAPEGSF